MESLTTYKIKCLIPLFLPWLIAEYLSFQPILSFIIAWLSSIFIFLYSLKGPAKHICVDLDLSAQVMRPIILIQLIFVGLMSGTSIFYFIDHLNFGFEQSQLRVDIKADQETFLLAACQRYYLFAHAALVFGMILNLKQNLKIRYAFIHDPDNYLILALLFTVLVTLIFNRIPSLSQIAVILIPIPKILAALILLKGLQEKRPIWILFGAITFCYGLFQASITGYKETTFVHLIIFSFIFYPYYKHLILGLMIPVFLIVLYVIPTWNNTIRSEEWMVKGTTEEDRKKAIEMVFENANEDVLQAESWDFLTNRFSEINMFSKYVAHVPTIHPYYGFQILDQAIAALIPKFLWPDKPSTEVISMERVYEAGIANRNSEVSAKTRPVVDGYLSAGYMGIFLIMLMYGMTSQALSNLAESLFGGYQTGCIIMFNGLFQQLWRGNNLEFILNNVLYGYILLLLIFYIGRWTGILMGTKAET